MKKKSSPVRKTTSLVRQKTNPIRKKSGTVRQKTNPIRKKDQVQQSNDERIDQDFPGFPHHPSRKETISSGSANAFEGTEEMRDDDDRFEAGGDKEDDDFVKNRDGFPDRGK
jgi:hypothetical protein